MKKSIVALVLVAGIAPICGSNGLAQTAPATPAQLAAITQRGRFLQAYDQAAWHGSDAAQAVAAHDTTGLKYFIAVQTKTGWNVDFGDLNPAGTAFETVIEATSTDDLHFTAQRFATPREDTGFLLNYSQALKAEDSSTHRSCDTLSFLLHRSAQRRISTGDPGRSSPS